MHAAETASLRRAALALVVVSFVRWAIGHVGAREAISAADVGAEHEAATASVTVEAERRARPLGPGETLDPNRADEGDLDRLPGIGPATASSIVRARDTGLVVRRPDDLLAVRGIGPSLVERISPFLDLRAPPPPPRPARRAEPRALGRIDLNRADAQELEGLPGIGPALAARIVDARREHPFRSVEELTRVSGIGPATLERLRDRVTVGPSR